MNNLNTVNRKELRYVGIVEARMTSSRLPGKMMMPIGGKPSLQILVERLMRTPGLSEVVVATTVNPTDDCLEDLCDSMGIGCFRGSEEDVLGRVLDAATFFRADVIVEITGDCTFIDPELVQECIDAYANSQADFVSNCVEKPFYPPGMDARLFSTQLLSYVNTLSTDQDDRDHVSLYFWEHPEKFDLLHVRPDKELNWPEKYIALDTAEDLEMLRDIYEHLSVENPNFSARDILRYLRANPEVSEICELVYRKGAHEE